MAGNVIVPGTDASESREVMSGAMDFGTPLPNPDHFNNMNLSTIMPKWHRRCGGENLN
jgi:hypothetical protein